MNRRAAWGGRLAAGTLLVLSMASLTAGSGHRRPPGGFVPARSILLREEELSAPAPPPGGAVEADLLRQIAAATRASARGQIELLRQQNEIIRLLEELRQQRGPAR